LTDSIFDVLYSAHSNIAFLLAVVCHCL
jgi:hypothetical protein